MGSSRLSAALQLTVEYTGVYCFQIFCLAHHFLFVFIPSSRLFPGSLTSNRILFGAFSYFNYRLGSLPGCELSFPFLYTCSHNKERVKTRALGMSQPRLWKHLEYGFPGAMVVLVQDFISRDLERLSLSHGLCV